MEHEVTLQTIAASIEEMKGEMSGIRRSLVDTKVDLEIVKVNMATKNELEHGLNALRKEMATKADVEGLRTEMNGKFDDILHVVNKSFIAIEEKMVSREECAILGRRIDHIEGKLDIVSV